MMFLRCLHSKGWHEGSSRLAPPGQRVSLHPPTHLPGKVGSFPGHRLHPALGMTSSIAPRRAQRVRKLHQESDNTTFSGGEDNCDSRSHLSNASAPSHPEAGPSRKRSRASDDSGPDPDPETSHEGGGRGSPEPGAEPGSSEIELVFRPHPLLVEKGEYSQTR